MAAGGGTLDAGRTIIEHVADSHPWFDVWWSPSKAVLWMAISAVLVIIGVLRAARGYDENGVPRTRWAQMLDPFVEHFYRDVAVPFAGASYARKVAPLLLTFFFFILTCNLFGLLPVADALGWALGGFFDEHSVFMSGIVHGSSTPTGNFNVTASLAAITFVAIIVFGSMKHGVIGHFSHLFPKGVPWVIRFFLLGPIEFLSMFVRPFALTMRLAANMTAGHMGLLALILMPAILKNIGMAEAISFGAGLPVVLLALGITLLEIIVCFVQAYVFALLSGVFIGMAIHTH